MHVPKTSGTSIMAALAAGHEPTAMVGGFDHSLFGTFEDFDELSEQVAPFIYASSGVVPRGAAVIAGHMALSTLRQTYPEARFMTILREPICRLLSHWMFWRQLTDGDLAVWWPWSERVSLARQPLESFISNPILACQTDNLTLRMLLWPHPLIPRGDFIRPADDRVLLAEATRRLMIFDFLDCVENPDLWGRIETWLQRPLTRANLNETSAIPPAYRSPLHSELTPAARQLLRERSRLDLRLWQSVARDKIAAFPRVRKTAIRRCVRRYAELMRPD